MTEVDIPAVANSTDTLATMELRRQTRYLCVDGGVMRLSIRPEFKGRKGLLLDISSNGIGFLLQDAVEAGSVLVFEVQAPPGIEPIGRVARVRHCKSYPTPPDAPWLPKAKGFSRIFNSIFGKKEAPLPNAWLVGCEFDRPLSEDEIRQFLQCLQAQEAHSP